MYSLIFKSPVGPILLKANESALTCLEFNQEGINKPNALLERAASQLEEYFRGARRTFDIPLCLEGTGFQTKVWKALQNIPYGKTLSYGAVAQSIGNPKASRAVGMANNRNPISIIVPCHRVIGAGGALTGYGGGLPIKEFLLDLEQKYK